jgi:hypothetical protein
MSAGLIQLVANKKKPYDFLIDNKSITFFKTVVMRHTNFIIEPKEQVFGNKPNFG